MKQPVFFLVGPTAVGKSKMAVALAERLGAEIISADSMQVYRKMDIGTAKPSSDQLKRIPHHLINILDPTENFSAYSFYQNALQAVRDITSRGKIPFVVGGTGFYIRTLLQGISEELGETEEFRKRLELETEKTGISFQYERLKQIDFRRAEKIMPNDKKRILRALEIYEVSGKKPSELPESCVSLKSLGFDPILAGLTMEKERLYQNIETRVQQMFNHGLVGEVRQLQKLSLSKTARQAVGYKEVLDLLSLKTVLNETDLRKVQTEIIVNTRHLAKRQGTWFRKEKDIYWFDVLSPDIEKLLLQFFRSYPTTKINS